MTTEANFWNTVKTNLPKNSHHTRIENRHGGGVPDVHVVWDGLGFWIELKVTKTNHVLLSPPQIAWNTAYSLRGGVNFILVKQAPRGDVFLFDGADALEISEVGLESDRVLYRGSCFGDIWNIVRGFGDRVRDRGRIVGT